jgi:hypothetical protein
MLFIWSSQHLPKEDILSILLPVTLLLRLTVTINIHEDKLDEVSHLQYLVRQRGKSCSDEAVLSRHGRNNVAPYEGISGRAEPGS